MKDKIVYHHICLKALETIFSACVILMVMDFAILNSMN